MSWTSRKPRQRIQPDPGWRAPHELVSEHAARGVEITRLAGALASAENMLALVQGRFAESQATVKSQAELILDLSGRIGLQADNHEADRAEWERVKSRLTAQVRELQETVVAMAARSDELEKVENPWEVTDARLCS